MEVVKELNPKGNLLDFFQKIFGGQRGYVYSPTKENTPDGKKWEKHFFEWPRQKEELAEHVLSNTSSKDVYYGPQLYSSPAYYPEQITPELLVGTYYVWAEFDYGTPSKKILAELNIPEPTLKVRTSTANRGHWYWRLDMFETDKTALETITRKLAYALDADLSGWDYQQVLRPPGTIHHDSQVTTLLIQSATTRYSKEVFESLPEPEQSPITNIELGAVPDTRDVMRRFVIPDSLWYLFIKKPHELEPNENGKIDRSDALMRIGYECAEVGMNNEEMFSILKNTDDRWGKFAVTKVPVSGHVSEPDRQVKNLLKIINRARVKYPLIAPDDLSDFLPIYGFKDFLATEVVIEWVIYGLLPKKGFLVLSGPPESGKTQVSLWIAIHIALGKPVFGWSAEKPLKIVFVSMEMNHGELRELLEKMAEPFTEEEKNLLQENLIISPLGFSVFLDKVTGQRKVTQTIDRCKPDGVMFDSLGVAIGDDIKSDVVIKDTFNYVNQEIREKRNCFVWFIHHHRKGQVGNKQPKHLDDLYGSMYIGAQASTILGVWPIVKGKTTEFNFLKTRMTPAVKTFRINRVGNGLSFVHELIAEEDSEFMAALTAPLVKDEEDDDEQPKRKDGFGLE